MCYCLFCFFVHKDEGRGEEASDAYEQCWGLLNQPPDHKLEIKVTALLPECRCVRVSYFILYIWKCWQTSNLSPLLFLLKSNTVNHLIALSDNSSRLQFESYFFVILAISRGNTIILTKLIDEVQAHQKPNYCTYCSCPVRNYFRCTHFYFQIR